MINKIRKKYFIQEIAIGRWFQIKINFRTSGFHHVHAWEFLKGYWVLFKPVWHHFVLSKGFYVVNCSFIQGLDYSSKYVNSRYSMSSFIFKDKKYHMFRLLPLVILELLLKR